MLRKILPCKKLSNSTKSILAKWLERPTATAKVAPGYDPSILRHIGIWWSADEAVLNKLKYKYPSELKKKQEPLNWCSRRCKKANHDKWDTAVIFGAKNPTFFIAKNPTDLKVWEEPHFEDKLGRNVCTVLKPHDGKEHRRNTLVHLDVRDLRKQVYQH